MTIQQIRTVLARTRTQLCRKMSSFSFSRIFFSLFLLLIQGYLAWDRLRWWGFFLLLVLYLTVMCTQQSTRNVVGWLTRWIEKIVKWHYHLTFLRYQIYMQSCWMANFLIKLLYRSSGLFSEFNLKSIYLTENHWSKIATFIVFW